MDHMAIDQYGNTYHSLGEHPKKALLARLGRTKADEMYIDTKSGTKHIGWIIDQQWLTVYEVRRMERPA